MENNWGITGDLRRFKTRRLSNWQLCSSGSSRVEKPKNKTNKRDFVAPIPAPTSPSSPSSPPSPPDLLSVRYGNPFHPIILHLLSPPMSVEHGDRAVQVSRPPSRPSPPSTSKKNTPTQLADIQQLINPTPSPSLSSFPFLLPTTSVRHSFTSHHHHHHHQGLTPCI